MKKYGVWCVVCVVWACAGCGDAEPATVVDMGTLPARDMTVLPTSDLGQPVVDLGTPTADQGTIPPPDLSSMGDLSTDMTATGDMSPTGDMDPDMSGAPDMTVDQGSGMAMCGNGVVEAGELCDGNCPASCDDGDACTTDSQAGGAQSCNLVCINQDSGAACGAADGCCPSGCTEAMDPDCSVLAMLDCRDPATWPAAWTQLEDALIAEVNMRRSAGGSCGADTYPPAPPLVFAAPLREAGRCHALDMVTRDYFASRSPEGESGLDRALAAGYSGTRSVGQDISTFEMVPSLVDSWMARQGNCNHILNPIYDDIGVGYMESTTSMYPRYWVQLVSDNP